MTGPKMTAREMNKALWSHFAGKWAVLTEVTARAQYAPPDVPVDEPGALFRRGLPVKVSSERRVDVLLVRANSRVAGGIERVAIEVKVTRADFHCDIRNPDKQAPWRGLAHRHAFAVPEGLVAVGEVPAESGLLVVTQGGYGTTVTWARRSVKPAGHNPGPLPLPNLMDAFYRAARAEAQVKGYSSAPDGRKLDDDPDALRAEVIRLQRDNSLLNGRLERQVEQTDRWKQAFAAHGRPACGTCGRPLDLARRSRRGYDTQWEHRDAVEADLCKLLRHAEAQRRNEELPEGRRMDTEYLWVPPAEPGDLPESGVPGAQAQTAAG